MKDILRKYNFYQVPLFRNIQYDNERKKKVRNLHNYKIIESIERQADIASFIQKFSTPYSFPEKIKFQPYISVNNKQEKKENQSNEELDETITKDITDIINNSWTEKFVSKEKKENVLIA